jgi:hypothetical protein
VDDPLGEYDPELFVGDISRTHYALLNKFPVMPLWPLDLAQKRGNVVLGIERAFALPTKSCAFGIVLHAGQAGAREYGLKERHHELMIFSADPYFASGAFVTHSFQSQCNLEWIN